MKKKTKTLAGLTESKDSGKSTEGSGMETNQAEQLDVLSNHSAKVVNNMTLRKQMPL